VAPDESDTVKLRRNASAAQPRRQVADLHQRRRVPAVARQGAFDVSADRKLISVAIESSAGVFKASKPAALFPLRLAEDEFVLP